MGWDVLLPIIVSNGINVAEAIWTRWNSKQDVTAQDWIDLKAIAAQDAKSRIVEALARAGLSIDDPKSVALLALVQ